VTGHSPVYELDEYIELLGRRLAREQRPATPAEMAKLRGKWEAVDRNRQQWERDPAPFDAAVGGWFVVSPPPDWESLVDEFAPVEEPAGEPEPATRGPKELGIPERELWWIIERRLENGHTHSCAWLARQTKEREDLDYVPRDRLTPLVDWVDSHREAAERAARLGVIPSEFRAGKLGPVPRSG
jgi:hypothetical protein